MNKQDIINKLNKAQSKYDAEIKFVESLIVDKVKFDFAIICQPSDGFCILDIKDNFLAPLKVCLNHIHEHGYLTFEDFKRFAI